MRTEETSSKVLSFLAGKHEVTQFIWSLELTSIPGLRFPRANDVESTMSNSWPTTTLTTPDGGRAAPDEDGFANPTARPLEMAVEKMRKTGSITTDQCA